jgi:hypothetical protein
MSEAAPGAWLALATGAPHRSRVQAVLKVECSFGWSVGHKPSQRRPDRARHLLVGGEQ